MSSPDFSSMVDAVDFVPVGLAVMSVAVLALALVLVVRFVQRVLFVLRGDGGWDGYYHGEHHGGWGDDGRWNP